jgi:hypothetical protein
VTLRNEKVDEGSPKFLTRDSHDWSDFPAAAGECLRPGRSLAEVLVRSLLLGEAAGINDDGHDRGEHAEQDPYNFDRHAF